MADISKYTAQVVQAFRSKNGKALAQELSLPYSSGGKRVNRLLFQLIESLKRTDVPSFCNSRISDSSIAQLVSSRLGAVAAVFENDFSEVYRHVQGEFNASLDFYTSNEDAMWFIPVLVKVSDDLRVAAQMADKAAKNTECPSLRDSIQSLTRAWTAVMKERQPVTNPLSKKLPILAITNILFKVYFSLNSLSLCTKLIKVLEGPAAGGLLNHLKCFPVCDVVMYKFFYGRVMMYEDKFPQARSYLRFALRYCPKSSLKNRQRILASLVCVEMVLGIMPTAIVGSRYGLGELCAIAEAAKKGNVQLFDQLMALHQSSLLQVGVYLVLENVRVLAVRNLVRRVYMICECNTRLGVNTLQRVLSPIGSSSSSSSSSHSSSDSSIDCSGGDVGISLDEVECILCDLIFRGRIKGYLSHTKRTLVLSKADPFPVTACITPVPPGDA